MKREAVQFELFTTHREKQIVGVGRRNGLLLSPPLLWREVDTSWRSCSFDCYTGNIPSTPLLKQETFNWNIAKEQYQFIIHGMNTSDTLPDGNLTWICCLGVLTSLLTSLSKSHYGIGNNLKVIAVFWPHSFCTTPKICIIHLILLVFSSYSFHLFSLILFHRFFMPAYLSVSYELDALCFSST